MLVLTLASIVLLLIFVAVLVVGVAQIMWALESIGSGPTSSPPPLLARICWGVRAIERQTDALAPHVQRLAASLHRLETSLERLRRTVGGLARVRPG